MKALKILLSIAVICSLINPMNVCAANDCNHEFVSTVGDKIVEEKTADYCIHTTVVVTNTCQICGYTMQTEYVEYDPHNWELVCVDPIKNGYQRICSKCGYTTRDIVYPYSISYMH